MLEIETGMEEDIGIIRPEGRLDAASSTLLDAAFERLIGEGVAIIILDAERLLYTSSSGLRVLLSAQKRLKQVGGEVRIAALRPEVDAVLTMTGLTSIFTIRESVSEALSG